MELNAGIIGVSLLECRMRKAFPNVAHKAFCHSYKHYKNRRAASYPAAVTNGC